jgi:hypothetical protein
LAVGKGRSCDERDDGKESEGECLHGGREMGLCFDDEAEALMDAGSAAGTAHGNLTKEALCRLSCGWLKTEMAFQLLGRRSPSYTLIAVAIPSRSHARSSLVVDCAAGLVPQGPFANDVVGPTRT